MNRLLAQTLTQLYARAWRARYGEEFLSLLKTTPATPATLADILRHAAATRRDLAVIAIAAAMLFGLAATDAHVLLHSGHAHHTIAISGCRSYTSVSKNETIERAQCLA